MSNFDYTMDVVGTPKETLGIILRNARKSRGLRQEDVADHLRVSTKQVGRWEKGENAPGSLVLVRLLKYFRQRADQPDLADLDAIVAKEVIALEEEEGEEEAGEEEQPGDLVQDLADRLSRYPQKFDLWLRLGTELLVGVDDTG